MKLVTVVFTLALSTSLFAQEVSREQKIQRVKELSSEIGKLTSEIFQPESSDARHANDLGVNVFRLMPGDIFNWEIVRDNGTFYSFTTRSHDYQKIAQIWYSKPDLEAGGYAGANYGLIYDLGAIELSDVTDDIPAVSVLLNYKAPVNINQARAEQSKGRENRIGDLIYQKRLPAVVGHSYVLRAIDFSKADILVTLKVIRKETDGSLIIFWKQLADFGKPNLDPTIKER